MDYGDKLSTISWPHFTPPQWSHIAPPLTGKHYATESGNKNSRPSGMRTPEQ